MTHRSPCQPLPFCNSVILQGVRRGDDLGLLNPWKVAGGTLLLPLSSFALRGGYREGVGCFAGVCGGKRQQTQV